MNQFASGTDSGFAHIWDTKNPKEVVKTFSNHLGPVHLDYHPEYYWLVSASHDKQICVYDLERSLSTTVQEAEKGVFFE